jgi:hypothetical protein
VADKSMSYAGEKVSYDIDSAYNYYSFRLRRMAEMSKYVPNAILLKWEDLRNKTGLDLVKQYLNLKAPLEIPDGMFFENLRHNLPADYIKKAQDCYERYLYVLRQRLQAV